MTPSPNLIRASTQEHLEIEDAQNNLLLLKDGSCALILQIMAINFNLLSESEQDAIIYAYASLLNSLSFPIQILIKSNVKDVSDYIRLLKHQEQKQEKPLLLSQLKKYRTFIENIVRDNQVLDKKFYIVIPFNKIELGIVPSPPLSNKKTHENNLPYPKNQILEKAKVSLEPKRDHLFRQLGRIGLQAKQLNTQELLELFYGIYNQDSIGQNFTQGKDYSTPIVRGLLK